MGFLSKLLKRKKDPAEDKTAATGAKEVKAEVISSQAPSTKWAGGRVLVGPHLTEKSTKLVEQNKYVFLVSPSANKMVVKSAVEARYGVLVREVRMAKTAGKERRRGRQVGWKPGRKKAIVSLKRGQTIDIQ